jgi:hypothetical protein
MPLIDPPIGPEQEEEWQELQAMLQSGLLDKAPNLLNFLNYVVQRHFAGTTDQIKEYSIAVQALHRPEQFDPQSDTIVRVTAHMLRRKLEQYYATEGALHRIQIRLPAGKYILQFERNERLPAMAPVLPNVAPPVEAAESKPVRVQRKWQIPLKKATVAAALILAFATLGIVIWKQKTAAATVKRESLAASAASAQAVKAASVPQERIHLRFGTGTTPYTDGAGQIWAADKFCTGGTTFSHPNREIQGTDDSTLFLSGRRGKFQCRIPVSPGSYQLLMLFADTEGNKEGAGQVDFSINDRLTAAMDIVDEAGGDDIAVGKIYPGIHPMSDGTIHLDFNSDAAFINALELTQTQSDAMQPLRMLAGPTSFHDSDGNTWLPERFFQGGRRTYHPDNGPKVANAGLFAWERYGHFRYQIPVVSGQLYRVKLYFSEGWFGIANGGPGGAGSRQFDVYCNGATLLKGFDILKDSPNGTAVITIDQVKPTAHGMLELEFVPMTNYPLVNAIEIDPESSKTQSER